jgi:tryptophan halogenase
MVQAEFNRFQANVWDDIRDFLTVHYKFNKRYDTPFWRHCWEATDLAGAAELVDLYLDSGPSFWLFQHTLRASQFGPQGYVALLIGQQVEYNRRYKPSEGEA